MACIPIVVCALSRFEQTQPLIRFALRSDRVCEIAIAVYANPSTSTYLVDVDPELQDVGCGLRLAVLDMDG